MTDLGPLLAAVTDEWERGKTIANRAGLQPGKVSIRLLRMSENGGPVVARRTPEPRAPGQPVLEFRRRPKAPPLASPPPLKDLLRDLIAVATEEVCHRYAGFCVGDGQPAGRDPECAACQAIVRAETALR